MDVPSFRVVRIFEPEKDKETEEMTSSKKMSFIIWTIQNF